MHTQFVLKFESKYWALSCVWILPGRKVALFILVPSTPGREQTDWVRCIHSHWALPPQCLCGTIRDRKIFSFPPPAQILCKCLVLTRTLFFVHCRPEHLPKRNKHCLRELSRSSHSDFRTTWGFHIKLYMFHGSQVEEAPSAHIELLSTLYWRTAYRWHMNCNISFWRKQFMGFPTFESVMGVQSTQLINSLIKQQRDCLGQGQTLFSRWRKQKWFRINSEQLGALCKKSLCPASANAGTIITCGWLESCHQVDY